MKQLLLCLFIQILLFGNLPAQNLKVENSQFPPVCDGIINPDNDPWTENWIPLLKNNNRTAEGFSAKFQIFYNDSLLYIVLSVQDSTRTTAVNGVKDYTTIYLQDKELRTYREPQDWLFDNFHRGYYEIFWKSQMESLVLAIWDLTKLMSSNLFQFGQSDNGMGYVQEFILPIGLFQENLTVHMDTLLFDIAVSDLLADGWSGSVWYATENWARAKASATLQLADPFYFLSSNNLMENSAKETKVGEFTINNAQNQESFQFEFEAGNGDMDNQNFLIKNKQLVSNALFDYETKSVYSIRVKAVGNMGTNYSSKFKIFIADQNEIMLSNYSLKENEPEGSKIGNLSTINAANNEQYTYSLIDDSTSNDNAFFTIKGNELFAKVSFNFEAQPGYLIHLRSTSTAGKIVYEDLEIQVLNVNEAPTEIQIYNSRIIEGREAGGFVTRISTIDPDFEETFTYELVKGHGDDNNDQFYIERDELYATERINYQIQSTYKIRIQSTDKAKHSIEKELEISLIPDPIALWITTVQSLPECDGYIDGADDCWYFDWINLEQTQGAIADDFSAEFMITHLREEAILIAVRVKDHSSSAATKLKDLDHIELYFSMDTTTNSTGSFKDNCWLIRANREPSDSLFMGYLSGEYGQEHTGINDLLESDDFKFGTESTSDGYIYEFVLPLKNLIQSADENWDQFRFNIAVVDNDELNNTAQRWWYNNYNIPHSDTRNYAIIQLIDHWEEVAVKEFEDNKRNEKGYVTIHHEDLSIHNSGGIICIYNLQGSVILKEELGANGIINISSLKQGMYLVKGTNLSAKFMK